MTFRISCFDPRDNAQMIDDPTSWRETENPALITAHLQPAWIKALDGFWDRTKDLADYCDEPVPVETTYVRAVINEEPPAEISTGGYKIVDDATP